MRAVLISNPAATTTTARTCDVLVHALASDLKIEVVATSHRGHAADLAADAAHDGAEAVVVLGGDGTVNEAVNGLLRAGASHGVPSLAVVPGGSTNVFARSLGLPADPVEATGVILDALREGRTRTIGLGRADERHFVFCAGLGFDAEVIELAEQRRAKGRTATPWLYVGSAIRHFFFGADRRHPSMTITSPDGEMVAGLFVAIVSNTSPWTYLKDRPVRPTPAASFETGLDVFGLTSLRTLTTLRHLRQVLSASAGPPRGGGVALLHDLGEFTITGSRPTRFQVDGEPLGLREKVTFHALPNALNVII